MTSRFISGGFFIEKFLLNSEENDKIKLKVDLNETNRSGVFIAGVVCGGTQTNRWFIENSRCHADGIFEQILKTV